MCSAEAEAVHEALVVCTEPVLLASGTTESMEEELPDVRPGVGRLGPVASAISAGRLEAAWI